MGISLTFAADKLKAKKAYPTLDHKGITNWLELRNKAAHPQPEGGEEFNKEDVEIMLKGVKNFISKAPA